MEFEKKVTLTETEFKEIVMSAYVFGWQDKDKTTDKGKLLLASDLWGKVR